MLSRQTQTDAATGLAQLKASLPEILSCAKPIMRGPMPIKLSVLAAGMLRCGFA